MLNDLLEAIKSASPESKEKIWCALNKSKWPVEMEKLKPENFETLGDPDRHNLIWRLMSEVSDAIGMKECLREWNRDDLPGDQFDEWWNKSKHMI